jgi:hypothetical protein
MRTVKVISREHALILPKTCKHCESNDFRRISPCNRLTTGHPSVLRRVKRPCAAHLEFYVARHLSAMKAKEDQSQLCTVTAPIAIRKQTSWYDHATKQLLRRQAARRPTHKSLCQLHCKCNVTVLWAREMLTKLGTPAKTRSDTRARLIAGPWDTPALMQPCHASHLVRLCR